MSVPEIMHKLLLHPKKSAKREQIMLQNKVTSQITMKHVQFVTGVLLISA